jgi:hypothetical protein
MQVQAAGRAEGGGGSGRAQARCSPIFPESFYPLAKLTQGGGHHRRRRRRHTVHTAASASSAFVRKPD